MTFDDVSKTTEAGAASSSDVEIKPFTPQAFESLFDAVKAYENETAGYNEEEEEPRPKKPVKIKEPSWEHLSREDVYGKNKKD